MGNSTFLDSILLISNDSNALKQDTPVLRAQICGTSRLIVKITPNPVVASQNFEKVEPKVHDF